MNCTIDASVFVAAARDQEAQHLTSLEFLDQIQAQGTTVFCPALVLAECAAAIARSTGDVTLAEELITLIESLPENPISRVPSSSKLSGFHRNRTVIRHRCVVFTFLEPE